MSDPIINAAVEEAGKIETTGAADANDTIRHAPRSKINVDRKRNPRKEKRYTEAELSPICRSILLHGLLEPLVLSERANGELWTLKGHRRLAAIDLLREKGLSKDAHGPAVAANPDFMNKIRARILKGLTIQGEMDILMDHGGVSASLGLDKTEKLLAAKILTRYGFSHDFIASKVGGSRSNFSNGIARVLALPPCVEDMYLSVADDAIAITQDTLKPLYAAYEKDLKRGGKLKEAGPEFSAEWEKLVRDGGLKTPKMIARKDLISIASVESDPDLLNLLQAIADGNGQDAGSAIERLHLRLIPFDTVGTGVKMISEGIESTVGDYERAE